MGDEKQINQELANPISRLGEAATFAKSDRFALFRTHSGNAYSYSLPYSVLAQQLVADISARFGLSSMAFRDTSEYAKFDHEHAYSDVACYPVFSQENADGAIRIMSLDIADMRETKRVDVYMPNIDPPPEPEPDIGDVRFLATSSLIAEYGDATASYIRVLPDGSKQAESRQLFNVNKQIIESIEDGTFDGWVFPDGSRYFSAQGSYDFSRAYRIFGGANGEFSVPNLSGFIKANPGTYCNGDALKRMPGRAGIIQHTHELADYSAADDLASISALVTVKMKTASNASSTKYGDGTVHQGCNNIDGQTRALSVDEDISLDLNYNAGDNKKFTYDQDPADESYPDHYVIPVQIYIGKDYNSL